MSLGGQFSKYLWYEIWNFSALGPTVLLMWLLYYIICEIGTEFQFFLVGSLVGIYKLYTKSNLIEGWAD